MKGESTPETKTMVPDTKCFARSVVQALEAEPTLEAVTIDRDKGKISLATLGQANIPRITERLTQSLKESFATNEPHACPLLEGTGDCHTCEHPVSLDVRQRLTI